MIHAALVIVLSQLDPPSLGTKPGGLDGGEPIGSAMRRCGQCHDRSIADPADPLVLPFDGWVSTMMANSVRDPLFQAALSVANQDVPGLGSWCLRCHAPQSYLRGTNVPPDGGAFEPIDTEGVTCDICHRAIAAPDSGLPVIGNAQIYFDPRDLRFGPYPDIMSPSHGGTDGGIVASSELCGQCHQVENPLVPWLNPEDGGLLGPRFPLDTTYDEWKQSQYATSAAFATCQDCHMPRAKRADGGTEFQIARFGALRDSPRRHVFAGGNLWGLEAVQRNDPAGTALLVDQFAETKRLGEELLRKAAELTVTVPDATEPGGTVPVRVHVKNNAGHKLPTGYADGRRVVVQMLINGSVHTGGFDGGYLVDDGWLRVYEVQHGKYGVGVEDHLAQHDMIVKDSRIPPSGFTPPNGAATVPVPATQYQSGDGTWADYDEVVWDVSVPTTMLDGETFDVTVRLLYQSTTPAYVEFLRSEDRSSDRGQNLYGLWKATGEAAPFEMARVDKKIPVRIGGAGGGSGGSGGSGGGGDVTGTGGGGAIEAKCGCGAAPGGSFAVSVLLLRRRLRTRSRNS